MPSLRTALLDFYLRSTLKPKPLHQIDPVELRAWFAKRALRLIPKGVVLESVDTETIHGEWHRPAGGASRTILYLHGGGFRILSKDTHWAMALSFAAKTGN